MLRRGVRYHLQLPGLLRLVAIGKVDPAVGVSTSSA